MKDTSTDTDKIFATLHEHSKKLKEFGTRHDKDDLKLLSKLEVAMLEVHEHIFTILNAD